MRSLSYLLICVLWMNVTAQTVHQKGFTGGIGLGYGYANGLNYLEKTSIPGYTVGAEIGYRFKHFFMLTANAYSWVENKNDQTTDLYSGNTKNSRLFLLIREYFFPFKKSEFYITTAVGAGNYYYTPHEMMTVDGGATTLSSIVNVGIAGALGCGYQFRLGKKGVIRTSINIYASHTGNLKFTTGETLANDKPSVIKEFTIGFYLLSSKP